MRAKTLSYLLKAGDRVAISNIAGREASSVAVASQKYSANIVGGWALGKGGQSLDVPGGKPIPVFATVEELMESLPKKKRPNKVIVYSPPPAVYGEIKEIVTHGKDTVETIFVVTEHVSIEVTAKIAQVCLQAKIDVVGCNSLGMINSHDGVRVGAVGGDSPAESFRPGSAAIFSNSGNMVNTMASYLQSAGLGTSYGVSTGKDLLILMPLKNLLELARDDERTKLVIAYIEPGGLYEREAIEMMRQTDYPKPIIAYVAGSLLERPGLSLGHAGAVVEGKGTSARDKMALFDAYFGLDPFDPEAKYERTPALADSLRRGIRISTVHHLPAAARLLSDVVGIERDFRPAAPLKLNPWFVDFRELGRKLPSQFLLHRGTIPKPYAAQVKLMSRETLGANPPKRDMRNASYASSNDGHTARTYGYSLNTQVRTGSFVESLILAWTGERPRQVETEVLERCLIAALTNGPGTISAQGAKLSASAGNRPNTALIAVLACIGDVHGGNGRRAVEYLTRIFRDTHLVDPWDPDHSLNLEGIVQTEATRFSKVRAAAKEAGTEYERIPGVGHPVFRTEAVNYDPRERAVSEFLKEKALCNVFLDFYHLLVHRLKEIGVARNVWAVNVDAVIATAVLGLCWKKLRDKQLSLQRVSDIAFMLFALGRVAGAGGEYLDHQDHGSPMDMRIPVSECITLTRPKD